MAKRSVHFTATGWSDYTFWQKTDKKTAQKITRLIIETQKDPFAGTGKPEPLKENLTGLWSRRITSEHRLVYAVNQEAVCVIACRYHYAE